MILNEPLFWLLFAVTAGAFFSFPPRWRHGVVVVSGLLFVWLFAGCKALWIVGLMAATFWAPRGLGVWLNIAALIGFLACFKGAPGNQFWEMSPVGFSFLTCELIHFSVERRRGRIPKASLIQLLAFGLYFPCRMCGPIKRFQPFEESIAQARFDGCAAYEGLLRILFGFVKKIVVADFFALFLPVLERGSAPLPILWGSLVAASLYIYLDFSAYSDIALGMSRILGLSVPENFEGPYRARTIRDFWNRWHMSFTSWLGDYLFLPLGKALAKARWDLVKRSAPYAAALLTFAFCGLWHGLRLHFLVWGFYHGILLSLTHFMQSRGFLKNRPVTFLLVSLGWIFFFFDTKKAYQLFLALFGIS